MKCSDSECDEKRALGGKRYTASSKNQRKSTPEAPEAWRRPEGLAKLGPIFNTTRFRGLFHESVFELGALNHLFRRRAGGRAGAAPALLVCMR